MKILVPVLENKGIKSRIFSHFGRAPYFALFNFNTNELEIIENKGEHFGECKKPLEIILKYKPDLIFAKGIGNKAIDLFKSKGIKIVTGDYTTVKEIIQNKERLKELREGCKK